MKENKTLESRIKNSLSRGWVMAKVAIHPTIFNDTVYDRRTVFSRKELVALAKLGYKLEDDAGEIALNILLGYERE